MKALPAHPRDDEPLPIRRKANGEPYDDLARLLESSHYTIRDWREAHVCENCGHCAWDPYTDTTDEIESPCVHGCCVVYQCAECGRNEGGFGPVNCPCDDGV